MYQHQIYTPQCIYNNNDTWGRQCNQILFVSNATDEKLPILLTDQNDNFLNLFLKTRQAFLWIYKNVVQDYDWFLKADDDTYFHMPNLRHFLKHLVISTRRTDSTTIAVDPDTYSAKEAVLRLGAFGFGYDPDCDNPSVAEDVYLGRCLVALNSSIVDASDENGAYR
ncbi:hypothetical protein COOONC_20793 [Cooperia oncophora]